MEVLFSSFNLTFKQISMYIYRLYIPEDQKPERFSMEEMFETVL